MKGCAKSILKNIHCNFITEEDVQLTTHVCAIIIYDNKINGQKYFYKLQQGDMYTDGG